MKEIFIEADKLTTKHVQNTQCIRLKFYTSHTDSMTWDMQISIFWEMSSRAENYEHIYHIDFF